MEDDAAAADARAGHGLWGGIARQVMRRPVLIATPVLLVLVLAGLPFFGIQLSTGGNLDDLPPSDSVAGFRTLEDEFPGGDTDPIEVAVQATEPILVDGALDSVWIEGLSGYVDELAALERVTEVASVLDAPAGMDEAAYLALITLPASERPAEAGGLAAWLDQWVAGDVTRIDVFSSARPDFRGRARDRECDSRTAGA